MHELKTMANKIMLPALAVIFVLLIGSLLIFDVYAVIVLLPAVILINILVSAKVRNIKCPHCNHPYGLRPNRRSWLVVPEVCQTCHQRPD